jgi:hypothetical protein
MSRVEAGEREGKKTKRGSESGHQEEEGRGGDKEAKRRRGWISRNHAIDRV